MDMDFYTVISIAAMMNITLPTIYPLVIYLFVPIPFIHILPQASLITYPCCIFFNVRVNFYYLKLLIYEACNDGYEVDKCTIDNVAIVTSRIFHYYDG